MTFLCNMNMDDMDDSNPVSSDWKENMIPSTTNSTCESLHSINSPEIQEDLVEWNKLSFLRHSLRKRTRTRSINSSFRSSLPIYKSFTTVSRHENDDGTFTPSQQVNQQQPEVEPESISSKLFVTASIRIWKRVALPNWMNVFAPRYLRLCTGPLPYVEYTRQVMGPVRERMYVSTITSMERIPKNKLILQFDPLNTWVLRFESKYERDQWTKKIQDAIELSTWMKHYRLGDIVMQTEGSTIVQAFNTNTKEDEEDSPSHVIKVMATDFKKTRLRARNELRVYHHITTHPNVLTISDSIRQTERAYVVLDYCAGGDLFDYLSHHGAMEETDAKTLFYYIIQAVAHVHKQGIIHLDIKPENLFFSSALKDASSIQLADFGSAQMHHDLYSPSLPSISCTIGYAAPEVLEHGMISYAADVFSLGAVLYTILCGYAPFHTHEQECIVEKTLHGDFSIETQEWQYLSPSAKELIGGMLEVQPNVRLSLEEVWNHPWLQSVTK